MIETKDGKKIATQKVEVFKNEYVNGGCKYRFRQEREYNLVKIEIQDVEYPITYGTDSSSDQILVHTVVRNDVPVGFHVIAPFEMPTTNKANVIKVVRAIGDAAANLDGNCQEPEDDFLQMLEEDL